MGDGRHCIFCFQHYIDSIVIVDHKNKDKSTMLYCYSHSTAWSIRNQLSFSTGLHRTANSKPRMTFIVSHGQFPYSKAYCKSQFGCSHT
jgi:hypothetical protein